MLLPKTIDTFGIWTQYTGFCFYEPHDILLRNGVMLYSMLPQEKEWVCNSTDIESWDKFTHYCKLQNTLGIKNEDVVAVKLLTDHDIEVRKIKWGTGKLRLDRIGNTYGDGVEHVTIRRDHLIKDHQVRETVNEIRDIAVKYGASQQLRAHVEKCFKNTFRHLFYNPK